MPKNKPLGHRSLNVYIVERLAKVSSVKAEVKGHIHLQPVSLDFSIMWVKHFGSQVGSKRFFSEALIKGGGS